ncbi:MAG: hypothetical protein SV186_06315 [Candidatus Nanohaloarchaea archaeon]|nr:hypothetical protein [Candidatus Nanohaloarchaea archaeon]
MRPQVTFKTSQPLQEHILQTDSSADAMDELRATRDRAMDFFADRVTVLDHIEDLAGIEYRGFTDIDIYVFSGRDTSVSSPIMLAARDDEQVMFVETVYFLAKELLYQNLDRMEQGHEMLEPGKDRFDVTAGMLAHRAIERIESSDFIDTVLDSDAFDDQRETWEDVQDRMADWDDSEQTLVQHLDIDVERPDEEG